MSLLEQDVMLSNETFVPLFFLCALMALMKPFYGTFFLAGSCQLAGAVCNCLSRSMGAL